MSAPVVFVDTETTGLDPEVHELWEIALIVDGTEHEFRLKPQHLRRAAPDALRITGFYTRVADAGGAAEFFSQGARGSIAWDVARLTAGRHLVAAVPSFDARFLADFLDAEGYAPAWHYHLVDIEALTAGRLGLEPPWDSSELATALGVPRLDGKHTALGDARWAKAMYEAAFDPGAIAGRLPARVDYGRTT